MSSFIAGKLLVASQQLRDPNFARSVVLMLEHTDDGALGVLLNRPSPKTIEQVWQSLDAKPVDNSQPVFLGGPVPGPLIALHTRESLSESAVLPGLYMSVQRDVIDQLVRDADQPLRLYSGHSGWGNGQLEDEMQIGGWHTVDAKVEDVFGDERANQTLWERVLQRIALDIMLPGIDEEHLPPDSRWN